MWACEYTAISWDKYYWRPRFATELTIGQLRQMQPVYDEIFVNCTVLNSRLRPVRCESVVPVQHFFSMAKHCYTFFEQNQELRNSQMEYRYASNVTDTKPRKGTSSSTSSSIESNITIYLQPENELKERLGNNKMLDMSPENRSTNGIVDEQVNASLSPNQTQSTSVAMEQTNFNPTSISGSHASTSSPFIYQDRSIRNREWMRLTVDRSHLWNQWLDVLITHRGRQFELFNGQPCFLTFSTEITNYAEFTFERTLVQRLSAPFESDCVHYPRVFGCLNRAHCVDICLGNLTIQRRRYWPFYLETIEPQFQLDEFKFEPEDAYNVLRSECSQKYSQPDCEITQQVAFLNRMEMCEPDIRQRESEESEHTHLDQVKAEVKERSNLNSTLDQTNLIDRASNQTPKSIIRKWKNLDRSQISGLERAMLSDSPQWNKSTLDGQNVDYNDNDPLRQSGDHSRESDNDSEEEIAPPSDDQLINTDCSSRYVTIVIKYSSEYTTRMVYAPIFDSMQLFSNMGQAVSVYLGLCLYDFNRLISGYTICSYERWKRFRQVQIQ